MSPRRMDISSLLRDPSPSPPPPLPLPASLLNILNAPNDRPRPPFLGLDALVHAADEERRRISAVSPTHPRHSPVQDHARPHKRPRDAPPPPSPSPPPLQTSLHTHLYPSASPTYPTLQPQSALHIDPTRSPHTFPSLQHPFPHTPPLLTHSSPRNSSPHRHSPQLLRSQHYSPIHSHALDPDAMSPRYSYGPRMAGGIEVLSSDPSPVRNPPRPDFSFYQSPGRDLSAGRLPSESHTDRPRHDPPKLSPLSARPFFLDDDKRQSVTSHRVEAQEVFPRERDRSRPHFPFFDATESPRNMAMSPDPPPVQCPPERHPFRVWEEQPMQRDPPRRVSPVRMPPILSSPTETRTWSVTSEAGYGEQATRDSRATSRRDVVENVHVPPLSASEPPPLPHNPTPVFLPSLQTSVERTHLSLQPLPISMQSEPHTFPVQTLRLNSPTPPVSTFPVLDVQSTLQAADTSASVSPTLSDPVVTEPVSYKPEPMHVCADANADLAADPLSRQPSPVPCVPVLEPGSPSTHADTSQSKRRSPSQQPFPAKEEHRLSENEPISPPVQPEPAPPTKREPPASEQTMMDVDEELLSLIEDQPTAPAAPKTQVDPPPVITVAQASGTGADQPRDVSDGPSLVSAQPILKGALATNEEKDRASMPPPAARNKKTEKDKASSSASTTGSKKKKDGALKPPAKPKQPPKPRVKPPPKPKPKPGVADPTLKVGVPKGVVNANARSRSTSVIPGVVEDVIPEPEPEDCDKEDDKLYCICKTRYDEDRMMIACDRCDEWFHTICVNMPDLEIELVDQFICPPCLQKHPNLRTTWKRRCLLGLQHGNPSSSEACHKPSRGAFSKYCSDECGIKSMQARIAQWEKSGGARDLLWESVKNATKREGIVCAVINGASPKTPDVESKSLDSAAKRRAEREVSRLNARLKEVVKERELMKRDLDMVMWREKVVELATERAGKVDECGWDQRLCFGEEEWADFGLEVLESYEEERTKAGSGDDAMPLDVTSAMDGEWWCTGKKKCERHAGWQKLRAAEVSFDKETKEGILLKLTTWEREIRKCIEDILYPQPTGTLQAPPGVQVNGSDKLHPTSERGKQSSRI